MPFGLKEAQATFCRIMSLVLEQLTPIQLIGAICNRLHILVEFYLRQRDGTLNMIQNFLQSLWQVVTFDNICLEQNFCCGLIIFQLQYLSTAKDPWGRRARWIAELQEYCFTTEYIKGDQNIVADAHSRLGFRKTI